jgi:DNA-binding NarL/FixJ family response regulator
VQRVVDGAHLRTNLAERRQVVAVLTRRGFSAADIAARLRVTRRTVCRIRARLRQGVSDAA